MSGDRSLLNHAADEPQPDRRHEAGSGGVFLVVITSALLLLIGLTFDGGRILAGRREAYALANEAALAGAQEVDPGALRDGRVEIDPGLAAQRATAHLAATGATGSVTVDQTQLTVTVEQTVPMSFLSVIGLGDRTVEGTATVRIVRGIEEADQ